MEALVDDFLSEPVEEDAEGLIENVVQESTGFDAKPILG
jgi:hypothetical protein